MISIFNSKKKKEWGEDTIFLHHTGNIYGIGCSITSEKAINKIKKIKGIHGLHITALFWEDIIPSLIEKSNLLSHP